MWYKVEDELPDDFQFVLVFTKQGKYKIGEVVNGKWFNINDEVVAWTELPEPPSGFKIQAKKIGGRDRYLTKKYR